MEATGPFLVGTAPLKHALEHLLYPIPKVSTQEGVQEGIHSRVEEGDEEGQRSEEGVEIR